MSNVYDVGSISNPRVMSPTLQLLLRSVTKIQNKIVAAAARIGVTGPLKPVISRKAHCPRICPSRREKILILGQTD